MSYPILQSPQHFHNPQRNTNIYTKNKKLRIIQASKRLILRQIYHFVKKGLQKMP